MDEENLSHQIESSKADVSEISEALENFDIDLALHEQFRNLDEQLRHLEIKFQSLINSRRS
jgi:predicted nuclease with TOPRIM domain